MNHRKSKSQKFNRGSSSRKALMLSLARHLFLNEKIETTLNKAKAVRPEAEKIVTMAREDTLANRRRLLSKLQDKALVNKLLTDIGPRYANANGGYTRIQRSHIRKGDNTQMAVLSFVEAEAPKEEAAEKETKTKGKSTKSGGTKKTASKSKSTASKSSKKAKE